MEEKTYSEIGTITVGEALDRLEVPVGKIGLNSPGQAVALLKGLDAVSARLEEMNPDSQSYKTTETQFQAIVARLKREGKRFLRDVGGIQALRRERAIVNPPAEHEWWFLDELVLERQRQSLRRGLITGGAVLAVLLVLVVVYNTFLAPDPKVAAVYSYQNSAQDALLAEDMEAALREAEQGLAVDPQDATLLITKGIVLELQGRPDEAELNFTAARASAAAPDEFYYMRGQTYLMAKQPEKAMADAKEAARINPKAPQAYLLSGQINEITMQFDAALEDYDRAFQIANEEKKDELAAMARMRTAMLLQTMGSQMPSSEAPLIPTPAP